MSTQVLPSLSTHSRGAANAGTQMKDFSWQDSTQRNAWIACVAGMAGLVWAYWLMFVDTAEYWDQPQYSHGWIVPLIALVMLWNLRPLQIHNPKLWTAVQAVAGVSVALIAAGHFIPSLVFLQGIGLAVGCVGGIACCLWGQSFATVADSQTDAYQFSHPEALWIGLGVGSLATVLGVFDFRLGPLDPDALAFLGLLIITVGFVLAAGLNLPSPVVSWQEIAAGLCVVVVCTLAWSSAIQYDRMPLARIAFLTSTIGVLTMVGGMNLVRWAGPPAVFLFFMFPLPARLEQSVLGFLQKIAVHLAEVVFTILGISAISEGKMIRLPGLSDMIDMEIAQACSGLSMTNILVAMGVAMVIMVKRPWWDRLILLLSAVPIAIISNVFRIVVTGLAWIAMDRFSIGQIELRDTLHTWIGMLLMMPFALGLLMLELKILTKLSVPEESNLSSGGVIGRGQGAPLP